MAVISILQHSVQLLILTFALTDKRFFYFFFQSLVAVSLHTGLKTDGRKEVNIHITMGCKVNFYCVLFSFNHSAEMA